MARTDIPRELVEQAAKEGPHVLAALEATYPTEAQLAAEQGGKNRQVELERRRRLRELARAAVKALSGELGPEAQSDATAVLTKDGDLRPEVSALARWDTAVRAQRPASLSDRPLLQRALENPVLEHALRAFEATRREERKR